MRNRLVRAPGSGIPDWPQSRRRPCRGKKRNETEYDFAGNVSEDEVQELLDFCKKLKNEVEAWLKKNHKIFMG